MRELSLYVGGMDGRRSVREVTARLRDVPGVETVSADPVACLVRLSGSMTTEEVLAAFAGTTYRPARLDGTQDLQSSPRDHGRERVRSIAPRAGPGGR